MLRYFGETSNVKSDFRGYFRDGRCIGVVATWGSFVAGDRSALHAHQLEDRDDFGYPLVYPPIDPQHVCTVRFKARYLINPQRPQIGGAVFTGLKKMALLKRSPTRFPPEKRNIRSRSAGSNNQAAPSATFTSSAATRSSRCMRILFINAGSGRLTPSPP